MATYTQLQDRMEKVNPPQTNWQFEAQLLQTRQSKYDRGHAQLSQLYGKLLNAGLTRDGNIKAREEFFKAIDQDLRKIAGMDLSKESNVSQAQNVFSQIYENDVLVKDMVWTGQFQDEMQRAESFRNCTDPEKCGGSYWEDGVKAMMYQRDEFKNMTDAESLAASSVKYVPYNNMMEKAIKYAEDAGLSVTRDQLSGRYIYRTKNGAEVISPLTDMFNQLFKDNPQFHEMYKVKAYNERKDWTYSAFQRGEYGSLDEAAAAYVEMRADEIIQANKVVSNGVDMDVSTIKARLTALQLDFENGTYTEADTQKVKEVQELQKMLGNAQVAQQYTDMVKNAQENMHNQTSMSAIGAILDDAAAVGLYNRDLTEAGRILAHKDMEVTMTADKFALAEQQHGFNVAMENLEHQHAMELEQVKAALKGNELDPNAGIYMMAYEMKKAKVDEYENMGEWLTNNLDPDVYAGMGSDFSNMSEVDIRTAIANSDYANKDQIEAKLNEGVALRQKAMIDANKAGLAAYKNGNVTDDIDFNWEVFTQETWNSLLISVPEGDREGLNIPGGVAALDDPATNYTVMMYPKSNALYYTKNGEWYIGNTSMDQGSYTKIKDPNRIRRLNAGAYVAP